MDYAHPAKRNGRTERLTNFIGMISTDVTDPVMSQIFKGMENVARIHGYTSILCDSEINQELEQQHIESLVRTARSLRPSTRARCQS